MDGRRVGRVLRAVRLHRRWRQRDVAAAAGVSQSAVSRAERGLITRVSFDQLDDIAAALDVTLYLDARWNGGNADRLVDRAHAAIVETVVRELRTLGWEVVVEFGFNHYGDRGSVDVLGWHASTRTLLIVEVKSILTDLQATFSSLARKGRVVPQLAERELGWGARAVARWWSSPARPLTAPWLRATSLRLTLSFQTECRGSARGSGARAARWTASGSCHPVLGGLVRTSGGSDRADRAVRDAPSTVEAARTALADGDLRAYESSED